MCHECTYSSESVNGDVVFDVVDPFTAKGFPIFMIAS